MKKLYPFLKTAPLILLAVGLASLFAGCSSVAVTRTVALSGLTPLANADQVTVVEEGKPISQPYQLVGAVTVASTAFQNNPGNQQIPAKGFSYKRMKAVAAAMGADGVIGVHTGVSSNPREATAVRSGLVVKWLAVGEAKRPVEKSFVVAVLPLAEDSKSPSEQKSWNETMASAVIEPLETKGYYVLPSQNITFKGGLEAARDLGDPLLQSLGGADAQLLLETTILGGAQANIIIGASASEQIRTTLMDKATRKEIFQGSGTGAMYLGWLLNMIGDKHKMAAGIGAAVSLNQIKSINEVVPEL
jgi:hypothetical protein